MTFWLHKHRSQWFEQIALIPFQIWNKTPLFESCIPAFEFQERELLVNSLTGFQFSSVQSLSHVWLFVTPWTAACQAPLSINNCWNLPKPMSIESVMPSNCLILCHPLLLLSGPVGYKGSQRNSSHPWLTSSEWSCLPEHLCFLGYLSSLWWNTVGAFC